MTSIQLFPKSLGKKGEEALAISWNDGHESVISWNHIRANCPCATCKEERGKPKDPFRVLKPSEIGPLRPKSISPMGHYAYKILWSDGHDTGIFTLEHLRSLCQCEACTKTSSTTAKP